MKNLTVIQNLIYEIRGQKVMIDSDLAKLYEVETRTLNQAVKRNIERFPKHYMFQLSIEEYKNLKSQNVTSSWGGIRKMPYAFTEQGVAMLSSVLKSKKAIQINIQIIDTFIKLRQFALENKELALRLNQIEQYLISHTKDNKAEFKKVYEVLNLLMDRTKPNRIGFVKDEE